MRGPCARLYRRDPVGACANSGTSRHRCLSVESSKRRSCVCQVLQFGALLDQTVSGHPAGAARRRHPLRRNGAQRARARRQARRSFPCARAPFWQSLSLRRAPRWDDYILLVSSELVCVLKPLVSSAPSCVLSGIPYSGTGSPRSSSRASPPRERVPAGGRLPDSGRSAPPACAV